MRRLIVAVLSALWVVNLSAQTVKDEDLSLVRAIVFKDGFVYTFREGTVAPRNGEVLLRTIPQAREGTLYAYIVDGKATYRPFGVAASSRWRAQGEERADFQRPLRTPSPERRQESSLDDDQRRNFGRGSESCHPCPRRPIFAP
jgi:hypothetical protein